MKDTSKELTLSVVNMMFSVAICVALLMAAATTASNFTGEYVKVYLYCDIYLL